jgi:hypothetical protein
MRYKSFRAIGFALAMFFIAGAPGFAEGPDATVKITGKSLAAGVGIAWGNGVLTYNGKEYPFSVTGISAGEIGVTIVELAGNVSNLNNVDDFSGNYASLTAGATIAGGAGAVTMRNQNGVVMNLIAMTRGLSFDLGVDGVKVQLKQ